MQLLYAFPFFLLNSVSYMGIKYGLLEIRNLCLNVKTGQVFVDNNLSNVKFVINSSRVFGDMLQILILFAISTPYISKSTIALTAKLTFF